MLGHGSGEASSEPLATESEPAGDAPGLSYSMSAGLVARLKALDAALAVTSYQSGLLYLIGRNPKTGVEVPIAPRRVMTFRASQIMRDRIAK